MRQEHGFKKPQKRSPQLQKQQVGSGLLMQDFLDFMQKVAGFYNSFGTDNKLYDYDGDGIVTVLDWLEFLSNQPYFWAL